MSSDGFKKQADGLFRQAAANLKANLIAERKRYTDIGHADPRDIIWRIGDDGVEKVFRGEHWTHELLWGKDVYKQWRGRFDGASGECSIAVPLGWIVHYIPLSVYEDLCHTFEVRSFYVFRDGDEFVEPYRQGE